MTLTQNSLANLFQDPVGFCENRKLNYLYLALSCDAKKCWRRLHNMTRRCRIWRVTWFVDMENILNASCEIVFELLTLRTGSKNGKLRNSNFLFVEASKTQLNFPLFVFKTLRINSNGKQLDLVISHGTNSSLHVLYELFSLSTGKIIKPKHESFINVQKNKFYCLQFFFFLSYRINLNC